MNPSLRPSRWKSFLFNLLANTTSKKDAFPYRIFWQKLYQRTRSWNMPVSTVIHQRPVIVGFNYTYPIFTRQFTSLNNPLVELVYQTFRAVDRPLRVVDVGAAIGDTVLLIEANCAGMVEEYICIDGDREFFAYLDYNLAKLPNCRRILHQLSSAHREERALVRTHGGTASAQGNTTVATAPLDDVLSVNGVDRVDVLKIDVDGFDGEVLAGAVHILTTHQPAVIFEWHPKLCQGTGNDSFRCFQILRDAGYLRTLWFTKYGAFSHFGSTADQEGLIRLQRHCLTTKTDADWHYDVVAFPESLAIDEQEMADLSYATHKPSPW